MPDSNPPQPSPPPKPNPAPPPMPIPAAPAPAASAPIPPLLEPAAAPAVPGSPECNCGPLTPQPGDEPIPEGTSADEILVQIQLLCEDHPGVFLFYFENTLFLRVVKSA